MLILKCQNLKRTYINGPENILLQRLFSDLFRDGSDGLFVRYLWLSKRIKFKFTKCNRKYI